jgi:hypothetical protein
MSKGPSLRYRAAEGMPWVHIQFPETADPFDICNAVRERLFPGVALEQPAAPVVQTMKRAPPKKRSR